MSPDEHTPYEAFRDMHCIFARRASPVRALLPHVHHCTRRPRLQRRRPRSRSHRACHVNLTALHRDRRAFLRSASRPFLATRLIYYCTTAVVCSRVFRQCVRWPSLHRGGGARARSCPVEGVRHAGDGKLNNPPNQYYGVVRASRLMEHYYCFGRKCNERSGK